MNGEAFAMFRWAVLNEHCECTDCQRLQLAWWFKRQRRLRA